MACSLLRQANIVVDNWTLGGGTAMMLQIGHRESDDVDIFLSDPQLLGLLDRKRTILNSTFSLPIGAAMAPNL
jgi:hypothetical protein